ncbi:condensation domain-containing protein [Streptomyces flaveolus]|uniref:condensation domain-containing protein n=1 Tax=Streptomyces flaveolus TaxID=67297 RepID=UPI0033248680
MSSDHSPAGAVYAVVHEPPPASAGAPLVFELCGPHTAAEAAAVAARITERDPARRVELDDGPAGRHLLRITPPPPHPPVPPHPADSPVPPHPADPPVPPHLAGPADPPAPPHPADPPVPPHPADSPVPPHLAGPPVPPVPPHPAHPPGPWDPADRTDPAGTDPFARDLLADLLAAPGTRTVPVTGHQREVLLAAVTGPAGGARHVEQLFWDWTGPLEATRFADAWQSLAGREAALRSSFDWTGTARLVLHETVTVEVARHVPGAVRFSELMRRDRERGFDLYRPALLRVHLLEGPPAAPDARDGSPTRVLVTYHRALLDERGARLLVTEFYRSYLAGGLLPGGERRPDIRDHAAWLPGQDTAAARAYVTAAAPPPHAAVSPGRPGARPGPTDGPGRIQRRLRPPQTARLRAWAAQRGAGESSALHAVWALLLYRAAGVAGPAPVAFGVHLSGRDLPMRYAASVPGLLGNALPMTVTVDPVRPLEELLLQARDAALEMSGYAWVPGERIRQWSGGEGDATETTVRFDSHPRLPEHLRAELAAQGIRVGAVQSAGGDTVRPITLVAHHDTEDALVLTALYDRARVSDTDASQTLSHCLHLLRCLPAHHDGPARAADVLDLLPASPVPQIARPQPAGGRPGLTVLRAGRPAAVVVCLVQVPGTTPAIHEALARTWDGAERIVALGLAGPQDMPPPALRRLLGEPRRLVVCGCGPAAPAAYALARQLAADSGQGPLVVMTGIGDSAATARALARALETVRSRTA